MNSFNGKKRWNLEQQVAINKCKADRNEAEIEDIKENLTGLYKFEGSRTVAELNSMEKEFTPQTYIYNISDSGNLINDDLTTLAVIAGDNVAFMWNDGEWYWDKMAGIIDTSIFLEKVTTATTYPKAYIKAADGTQSNMDITTYNNSNTLMQRDSNGRSSITAPIGNEQITNKKYVDDGDALKLDKDNTVTTYKQAYTKEANGTQSMTDVSKDVLSGALIIRDSYGRAKVANPDANLDIVNKQYVDGLIPHLYLHNIGINGTDSNSNSVFIVGRFYTASDTPFTTSTFGAYLNSIGQTTVSGINTTTEELFNLIDFNVDLVYETAQSSFVTVPTWTIDDDVIQVF